MNHLSSIFSDYRSEWIVDDFDERFVAPPYYNEVVDVKPMFLVGARGTGKTIALRSLHFSHDTAGGPNARLGIYIKAFKSRVTAFRGEQLEADEQIVAFEHYINLLCCAELADLCRRRFDQNPDSDRTLKTIELACTHFSISPPLTTYASLYDRLRVELAVLNRYVIDPKRNVTPRYSAGELPVVDFARDVHVHAGRPPTPVYVCIDEWENLSELQQEALNRWIKNCTFPITYKLGIRVNGMRTRSTGGPLDPISSPADYHETNILEGRQQTKFCKEVAEKRLERIRNKGYVGVPSRLDRFLQPLDRHEESKRLGAQNKIRPVVLEHEKQGNAHAATWLQRARPGDAYLAIHLAERGLDSLPMIIERSDDPKYWRQCVNNYGYASLFSVTRGLKGRRIRKYYAGQTTYLGLCGGNVRYLLELLDAVVNDHLASLEVEPDQAYEISISPETQTTAATLVARRHLDRIIGLSESGLRLSRLVRSVGTALSALAREPKYQSAPELTNFTVGGETKFVDAASTLLHEGCAVLALVSMSRTKRTSSKEMLDNEYRLHPILTPHFSLSYRRKRRMRLDARLVFEAATEEGGAQKLIESVVGEDPPQLDLLLD